MKYCITIPLKSDKQEEVEISLDTANAGTFKIYAYGTNMDFEDFVVFADAIQEIREKFAVVNGKYEQAHGTGNAK